MDHETMEKLLEHLRPIANSVLASMSDDEKKAFITKMTRKVTNDFVGQLHTLNAMMGMGAEFEQSTFVPENDDKERGLNYTVHVTLAPTSQAEFNDAKQEAYEKEPANVTSDTGFNKAN